MRTVLRQAMMVWICAFLIVFAPAALNTAIAAGENERIQSLEFKDARVINAIRVLSELTGVNIVATKAAGAKEVSLFIRDTTVGDAIDGICRVSGLWYRYNSKTRVYLLMTAEEYKQDIVVYRNDQTRVFTLQHQNVLSAARIIEGLFDPGRVEVTEDADEDGLEDMGAGGSSSRSGSSSSRSSSSRTDDRDRRSRDRDRRRSSDRRGGGRSGSSSNSVISIDGRDLTAGQVAALRPEQDDALPAVSVQELSRVTRNVPPIYITTNRMHNQLFVRTADEEAMADIARIIKDADKPLTQVLLEMKILQFTVGDDFRSIFNIGLNSDKTKSVTYNGSNITGPGTLLSLGNQALQGGQFLFQILDEQLQIQLELFERDNKVEVLATPMLLAANNQLATIFIGDEVPVVTGSGSQTTIVSDGNTTTAGNAIEQELREIGTTLEIRPRINSDRTVTLSIFQDSSEVKENNATILVPGAGGTLVTQTIDTVSSSNISGIVVAQDGLTVAIGGLIKKKKNKDIQKVPLLGDIPAVGTLFTKKVDEESKTELVLLITPHIITSAPEGEQKSRQRLGSTSDNPEIDRGGFQAGKNRTPSALDAGGAVEDFIIMTRFAANSLKDRKPVDRSMIPTRLKITTPVFLTSDGSLEITPHSSWRRGSYYVTAVVIKNKAGKNLVLDGGRVAGNWRAITFDRPSLAAHGRTGDRGLAFLISDQPFLETLAESPEYATAKRLGTLK